MVNKLHRLVLEDLCRLTVSNPDQLCIANEDMPQYPVSLELVKRSKHSKKLFNALIKAGIYNFFRLTSLDKYVFVCKDKYGRIFRKELPKSRTTLYKYVVEQAYFLFKEEIENTPYIPKETDTSSSHDPDLLSQINSKNVNIPDSVNLTPDMIKGINEAIAKVASSRELITIEGDSVEYAESESQSGNDDDHIHSSVQEDDWYEDL